MLNLKAGQFAVLTMKATDGYGNPAPVEDPVWDLSDEAVCRLELDPVSDPSIQTAKVFSTGTMGTCLVEFTGDAVVGAGNRPIVGTLDVVVAAGDAVVVAIEAGPAQDAQ